MGGTQQHNDDDENVRKVDTDLIEQHVFALVPALREAEVVADWVRHHPLRCIRHAVIRIASGCIAECYATVRMSSPARLRVSERTSSHVMYRGDAGRLAASAEQRCAFGGRGSADW
jgi:hypothetical protein